VYGPAADAGVDRDKQRLNQAWLDTAMPAWMAEGGNVREQHDPKRAVGVGVGLTRAEDGTHMLAAAVVDPIAITKVRPGVDGRPAVLKGFSVGIKDPRIDFGKADAPNGEVVGGQIIEVSLVDRPANPRTLFTMVKADAATGDLADVEDPELVEDGNEDTVAQAEEILAEVRVLVPAVATKADAATDVATAQDAIACIGRLIASEAEQLANGDLDEAGDISCLLDAVSALKYFIRRESTEITPSPTAAEVADSMSVSGATYMAEKTDEPTTPTTPPAPVATPPAPAVTDGAPDLAKVDASNLADMVKAAVAEANAPLRDELTLVKADLAKALAMPEPGGPVAMRTAAQTLAARGADAVSLRAQAKLLLEKAEAVRRDDPTLAAGYRERAAELLSKADA